MKSIVINTILTVYAFSGFAQDKNELKDDLLQGKDQVLAKYIPMANGDYLYKLYAMPSSEVIDKLEGFKNEMKVRANQEPNTAIKVLMLKDIDFYARQALNTYVIFEGMDSIGMKNLGKIMTERKGAADFNKLVDSAQKKAFVKQLGTAERKQLKDRVNENVDLNDEALFKRSAAYRNWLDDRIIDWMNTKYSADTTPAFKDNNVAKLRVIEYELPAGFVKDYLTYKGTAAIIKMTKNAADKENAYRNFMAKTTNPVHKKEIEKVYGNYKMIASHSTAPDFTYNSVDGKMVSLKDLRGKYVYIDVWATWCVPCKAEIPFLTKIEEAYHGKNIHFVSLSVDRMADETKWASYIKDNKLQGIQLMADKDFSSDFIKKFNINSIPRFILIDPAGKIVSGDAKRPSDPALQAQLDQLLLK